MTILDQVKGLAAQGVSRPDIEATIGRELSPEEDAERRKIATARRLKRAKEAKAEKKRKAEEAERRARENIDSMLDGTAWPEDRESLPEPPKPGQTSQDRLRAFRERGRDIGELPKCADPWRRMLAEYSLLRFGLSYCMHAPEGMEPMLQREPSQRMKPFVQALQDTIVFGGYKHVRWPRGKGKTTWVKIAAMWAALYGIKRFFVVVAKDNGKGREAVEEIWRRIYMTPEIAADFPEFAVPMRDVAYQPQRMRSQTFAGHPTRMRMDVKEGVYKLPTITRMPHTGAILSWKGARQALRGLNVESMRPDFVALDDPQTDEDSKNKATVGKIEENIQGNILGLGSLSKRLSAVMTSTPISPDDISERFADPKRHPEWLAETTPLVISWGSIPLRDRYLELCAQDYSTGDTLHAAANAFYSANRDEIERGAQTIDDAAYDPRTELSAYHAALNKYFDMKHASFYTEMQLQPQTDAARLALSPQTVLSRVRTGQRRSAIPDGTILTILATDINPSYALTSTLIAYDQYRTGVVVDHWLFPVDIPSTLSDVEFHARIYDALATLAATLEARGIDPYSSSFVWGIDAGGLQWHPVRRFAFDRSRLKEGRIRTFALRGQSNKTFNPYISTRKVKGAPGRNDTVCCIDKSQMLAHGEYLEHVYFNKDKYEVAAQKAWLSSTGTPGGLSLFEPLAQDLPQREEFALQVCGERLTWMPSDPDAERKAFAWDDKVYPRHDYGDAVYMSLALAGFLGLATSGNHVASQKRRRRHAIIGGTLH